MNNCCVSACLHATCGRHNAVFPAAIKRWFPLRDNNQSTHWKILRLGPDLPTLLEVNCIDRIYWCRYRPTFWVLTSINSEFFVEVLIFFPVSSGPLGHMCIFIFSLLVILVLRPEARTWWGSAQNLKLTQKSNPKLGWLQTLFPLDAK